MGRFLSPDPLIPFNLKRDQFQAWISNPQHWNKYAYALNNPLKYTDPTGMTETIYYFFNSNLSAQQKAWINNHLNDILGAIAKKLNAAGIKDVQFRNGSQLSSKQIGAIEAAHPKGVNFLNFANTDYPGIGPAGRGSGTDQYGIGNAPGMRAAVLFGRLDNGQGSDSELVFRVSEVGSHELGHGMGFKSTDWGFFNFIHNSFSNDLMNEGQGMPNSQHPENFDMTVPQNRQTVDEINQQPAYTPPQ
jgi:hypothetical protein